MIRRPVLCLDLHYQVCLHMLYAGERKSPTGARLTLTRRTVITHCKPDYLVSLFNCQHNTRRLFDNIYVSDLLMDSAGFLQ